MNKVFLSLLLVCFFFGAASSVQAGTKNFELKVPQNITVSNSLYNNVEYLDSRVLSDDLGFVQTSLLNSYTPVKEGTPISEQISFLMKNVIDTTAQAKTLLYQLRNLYFSEVTGAMTETGYCHIRISLYEKKGKGYYHINTLDSLVEVKAMDVTGKLLKTASEVITSHFTKSITEAPSDPIPYSIDDVRNVDLYEKHGLKLYSAEKLEDGIYPNFESFVNQTPDKVELTPKYHYEKLLEVKYLNPIKNKQEKVKPNNIYAVVIGGEAYITSNKSYFSLYKENGEFKFLSDGTVRSQYTYVYVQIGGSNNLGTAITSGVVGGLVGGLLSAALSPSTGPANVGPVIMTLDHLKGRFIATPR